MNTPHLAAGESEKLAGGLTRINCKLIEVGGTDTILSVVIRDRPVRLDQHALER